MTSGDNDDLTSLTFDARIPPLQRSRSIPGTGTRSSQRVSTLRSFPWTHPASERRSDPRRGRTGYGWKADRVRHRGLSKLHCRNYVKWHLYFRNRDNKDREIARNDTKNNLNSVWGSDYFLCHFGRNTYTTKSATFVHITRNSRHRLINSGDTCIPIWARVKAGGE